VPFREHTQRNAAGCPRSPLKPGISQRPSRSSSRRSKTAPLSSSRLSKSSSPSPPINLTPKRAGLLLYGLQVASANAKNVHVDANSIRSISYTKEGIPLATQEHGWDVEDIEEADRLAEEEEEDN
jgi:hypothetical protein